MTRLLPCGHEPGYLFLFDEETSPRWQCLRLIESGDDRHECLAAYAYTLAIDLDREWADPDAQATFEPIHKP